MATSKSNSHSSALIKNLVKRAKHQKWMLTLLLVQVMLLFVSSVAGFRYSNLKEFYYEQDLAKRFRSASYPNTKSTRIWVDPPQTLEAAAHDDNGWWRPVRPRPTRRPVQAPRLVPIEPYASALDLERLEVNELHRERTIPNIIQCLKDFVGIITGSQTEFSAKCCVVDIFGVLCKKSSGEMAPLAASLIPKPTALADNGTLTLTTTTTTGKPATSSTPTSSGASTGKPAGNSTRKLVVNRRSTRRPLPKNLDNES